MKQMYYVGGRWPLEQRVVSRLAIKTEPALRKLATLWLLVFRLE